MSSNRIVFGALLAGLLIVLGDSSFRAFVLTDPSAGTPLGIIAVRDLLLGASCVLLYSAMRTRYGAGRRTALVAGTIVFLLGVSVPAFALDAPAIGSASAQLASIAWQALLVPLATLIGAAMYADDTLAPARTTESDRFIPAEGAATPARGGSAA